MNRPPCSIVFPWKEELMTYLGNHEPHTYWAVRDLNGRAWGKVEQKDNNWLWRVTNIGTGGSTANVTSRFEEAKRYVEDYLKLHKVRIVHPSVAILK